MKKISEKNITYFEARWGIEVRKCRNEINVENMI